jgi:PAS domain S-box-containing protein
MRDPSQSSPATLPAFAPAIGLREVLEAAPDLIFCCDSSGRFAWASSTFESLAGHRASDLVGQFATELLPAPDRVRFVRTFRRQLRRSTPHLAGDFTLQRPDGPVVHVAVRVRLYERADGERYFVGVARECAAPGIAQPPAVDAHAAFAPPAFAFEPAAAPEHVAAEVPAQEAGADPAEVAMLEARVRELQIQIDEAREGDRLKREVLATLSQEIRPPMDAVFGTAATLLETALAPEQRRAVETIQNASQTLMNLVGDAYDHAQLETGQMAIENLEFDLRVTAQQVSGLLAPLAEAHGLGFDLRVEPLVPSRLKGDPGRLRQVLLNLGGNAIRLADSGRVELRMERESEDDSLVTLLFRVKDPGTSPGAERRARIFREHGRDEPESLRVAATPELGLSVSRRLVHLMGGLVGVDALPEGGRVFWFRLSFEKQAMRAAPPAQAVVRLRDLRVLVADGTQSERRQHAGIVSAWGCEVVEAEHGIDALERIREAATLGRPFDVALLDMGLDGLDGESLASAVRADHALDATRLVMTTRLGRPGDALRARELGFAGYLVKPLDASQLFDALTELVSSPAARSESEPRPLVTRHSLAEAKRARVRILLVEDDAVNQLVTQSALNRVGFHVEAATSGRQVIERTENEQWDLVLLDVQLRDLDGPRLTTAIRARERGAWRTPIVGLSYSEVTPAERERCLAAGMDELFGRPTDLAELAAAVERWTARVESRLAEGVADEAPARESPARLTVVSAKFEPPAPVPLPVSREPLQLPEPPQGPAIDIEQLNVASMGVPALRASMLTTFVADLFPRLQAFEQGVESADTEAVEAEAARLRRMCTTVGASGCARLFGVAEDWARSGRPDQVARLLPLIVQEVRRAEEFVTRLEHMVDRDAA